MATWRKKLVELTILYFSLECLEGCWSTSSCYWTSPAGRADFGVRGGAGRMVPAMSVAKRLGLHALGSWVLPISV